MPEIINKYNVDLATPSNMINDFNFIKEVLVWVFITYDEKNEIYKINIRSRGPIINTVAEQFHGGGHKFASGARIKTMEEVDLMLQDLNQVCEEYQKLR
jgi:phosphoesterase RecJ-like protein